MGSVLPFTNECLNGLAICTGCKYEWPAVAPVGVASLECPECHSEKGIWKYPCIPEVFFRCNCGNDLYYVTDSGCICRECGETWRE